MEPTVLCIASSQIQATNIVGRLKAVGFSTEAISVLLADTTGTTDFVTEPHPKAPESTTTSAPLTMAALGLVFESGKTTLPGVGPILAAGPLKAALSRAGIAGALIGLGIPEIEARAYEGRIRGGKILMAAHTPAPDRERAARQVFEAAGASHILATSDNPSPRAAETPWNRDSHP